VTIALPNAGKRFMSLQAISEDHYVPIVAYGSKAVTLARDNVSTRYVLVEILNGKWKFPEAQPIEFTSRAIK
jgi:hypothetical protein